MGGKKGVEGLKKEKITGNQGEPGVGKGGGAVSSDKKSVADGTHQGIVGADAKAAQHAGENKDPLSPAKRGKLFF